MNSFRMIPRPTSLARRLSGPIRLNSRIVRDATETLGQRPLIVSHFLLFCHTSLSIVILTVHYCSHLYTFNFQHFLGTFVLSIFYFLWHFCTFSSHPCICSLLDSIAFCTSTSLHFTSLRPCPYGFFSFLHVHAFSLHHRYVLIVYECVCV